MRVPHATMEDVVPTLVMIYSNADALLDFLEIDVKLKVKYVDATRESIPCTKEQVRAEC